MEITRDVILDLLPLYIAKEASEDTVAIVENYLETDPEFAKIALQSIMNELPGDIPVPLTKESKMEAYKEAKKWMFLRTLMISFGVLAALSFVVLVFLMFARSM